MLDFAGIAKGFSGATGSPYGPAVAKWQGVPTYDAGGSITSPGVSVSTDVQVQFDAATQSMRGAEGFLETDVRAIILNDGIDRPIDTDAAIIVANGHWAGEWQLLSASLDPAGFGYECRARKVS